MIRNITLPTKGRAFTNYSDDLIPRSKVADAVWAAVNAFDEVLFTRHLDGTRCTHQCARAKAGSWITCSCVCGGTHHGGVSRGFSVHVDEVTGTSTLRVTRDNVEEITGLPLWGPRFTPGDRVEYVGEFAPSSDDPTNSDLATVVSVNGDEVEILWDYSGEIHETYPEYLRSAATQPAA